jgi:hypothetical protein
MMPDTMPTTSAEQTLPEMLAGHARRASDGRLVADVIFGSAFATSALVWQPPAWFIFATAACCFAMFGLWGITDRIILEQPSADRWTRVLRGGRIAAAVVGGIAAVGLIYGVWGFTLGNWIS